MNKNLISQNPVQKFKLGKQIQKFQKGNPIWFFNGKQVETTKVGQPRVDGQPINNYENNPSFQRYDKVINTAKGKIWAIRDGKYYDPSTGKLLNTNGLIFDKNSGKKYSVVNGEKQWYTTPKVDPEYNGGKPKVLKKVAVTAKNPTTVLTKATTDWGTEYQKALGNLTQAQKDYLTSLGADLSDVKSLQKVIGTKDDGMFGDKSNSALIAKLAEMPKDFGISNKPNTQYSEEIKQFVNNAMNQTQINPYRAYSNYSGQALKNLGFNNYNTMVNYVLNNPQNQFSKDLTKLLGDVNTWNQADIEQKLGVSGNYRGSRTGDFGDMARSMNILAGTWNGTQDGKADLASRTGNDGIVYSNSRVRDLFDKYASKSLLSRNPVTRFKKGGFVNFRIAAQ